MKSGSGYPLPDFFSAKIDIQMNFADCFSSKLEKYTLLLYAV